ncbi:MAG: hypothetical protein Q8J65_02735 [Nitrosomonadales bacterium]|nr:hypothetical protein [Nitrosomonadales bacterium]
MRTNYLISRLCFSFILLVLPVNVLANGERMNGVLRQSPMLANFEICHGGGCTYVSPVQITLAEWQELISPCEPVALDAEAERVCIANIIGALEQVVGNKTGTNTDRGGTFGNSAYSGQMDCNDEAINSTTYLKLIQKHGLIQYHDILDIKHRGFFLNRWPHTTAAILDRQSQQRYAVDAWFYDNGSPAVVVPFELWKSGWKPEDSQAR